MKEIAKEDGGCYFWRHVGRHTDYRTDSLERENGGTVWRQRAIDLFGVTEQNQDSVTSQGGFPVDAFISVWVWEFETQNCGI